MLALVATLWRSKVGRSLLVLVGGAGVAAVLFASFHIWMATHDAAIERAARAGYVLLAEKTAAEARLAEVERQRAAASITLDEHRRRLAAAQLLEEQRSTEREREILAYELRLSEANRRCLLDRDDVDFLQRDRSAVGGGVNRTGQGVGARQPAGVAR